MTMTTFSYADKAIVSEAENIVRNVHDYFIIARTSTGARFYSENFGKDSISKYIKDYKSMVNYFGGGTVELWECSWGMQNIIFID